MVPADQTDTVPESSQEKTAEIVTELESTLQRASSLLHTLQTSVPAGPPPQSVDPGAEKIEGLKARLENAETDLSELSGRLVIAENQRSRLMNLYVATYQLHATLDLEEVITTIGEIVRELLGAQRFVLLLRNEAADGCQIVLAEGLDKAEPGRFSSGKYSGGDSAVDATLADGVMRIEPEEGSQALVVVPLTVQSAIVGAVVVLKLFDHKSALTADDKDLLDLLAAHAASALFAARVYSATDRKLRTLESLVKLVR